jgi:hypothetical protein
MPTHRDLYQFTCTEQRATRNGEIHKVTPQLWVFSMEPASCHPAGDYNFEVPPRFLENLWYPDVIINKYKI